VVVLVNGLVVAIPDIVLVIDGVLVNGCVVGIPVLLLVILTDVVLVTDTVIDLVNGLVVAIPVILLVILPERVRVKEVVRVTDTLIVLVNGCVVAIPEIVLVKEPDVDRVRVTDLVYEGDVDRVFSWDGSTVTLEVGLLVNGLVVGIPDILLVTVTERVRVNDIVRVRDTLIDLVNGLVVAIPEILLVIEPEVERVKVTDLVYEGEVDRVFSWEAATVMRELGDLVNGLVVAIPVLLLVILTERVRVKDMVLVSDTEVVLVNCLVVGIPVTLLVILTDRVRVKDVVLVKETDAVLVNGLVVGFPELVLVKDPEVERVKVTELVYDELTVGVGTNDAERVKLTVTVLVNGYDVGFGLNDLDTLLVKEDETVLVTDNVCVGDIVRVLLRVNVGD
jgi:hypothetical protein